MKDAEIFAGAADYIEKHGLNQEGNYYPNQMIEDMDALVERKHRDIENWVSFAREGGYPVCAYGAIAIAARSDSFYGDNLSCHGESLLHGKIDNSVPAWNDDPNTTKEDVVRVLRECAAEVAK